MKLQGANAGGLGEDVLINPGNKAAVTAEEMRQLEDKGESRGISKLLLMENAGAEIATQVQQLVSENMVGSSSPKRELVTIVAGTGNNGGDAFVAARHLAYYSNLLRIEVYLVGREEDIKTEAARKNWGLLKEFSAIHLAFIQNQEDLQLLNKSLTSSLVVVVAIFGTGFKGIPRELQLEAIKAINSSHRPVVSVDLPSGMEADTGKCDFAVNTFLTVTMHAPKKGMLENKEARVKCGKVVVANIGLPF